jgi:hypothetical protein
VRSRCPGPPKPRRPPSKRHIAVDTIGLLPVVTSRRPASSTASLAEPSSGLMASQVRADVLSPQADISGAVATQHEIGAQMAVALRTASDPRDLRGLIVEDERDR